MRICFTATLLNVAREFSPINISFSFTLHTATSQHTSMQSNIIIFKQVLPMTRFLRKNMLTPERILMHPGIEKYNFRFNYMNCLLHYPK